MSHFTVAVLTDGTKSVEETLQPFHEYECTGNEDEYVVFVKADESLEELQKEYKEHLEDYSTLEEFIEEYYGYHSKNGQWGRLTNPNAKWDWWTVGGRWSGMLKTKSGKVVDEGVIKDLDFETVINEARKKAEITFDKASKIIAGRTYISWSDIREACTTGIEDARNAYHEQPVIIDLKKMYDHPFANLDQFLTNKDTYIDTAGNSAISTFAVIKDGKWHEKGEMGWFGMASNEKEQASWNGEFMDMLNSCKDTDTITIVDCHI